jgi:hypothetical protein
MLVLLIREIRDICCLDSFRYCDILTKFREAFSSSSNINVLLKQIELL